MISIFKGRPCTACSNNGIDRARRLVDEATEGESEGNFRSFGQTFRERPAVESMIGLVTRTRKNKMVGRPRKQRMLGFSGETSIDIVIGITQHSHMIDG